MAAAGRGDEAAVTLRERKRPRLLPRDTAPDTAPLEGVPVPATLVGPPTTICPRSGGDTGGGGKGSASGKGVEAQREADVCMLRVLRQTQALAVLYNTLVDTFTRQYTPSNVHTTGPGSGCAGADGGGGGGGGGVRSKSARAIDRFGAAHGLRNMFARWHFAELTYERLRRCDTVDAFIPSHVRQRSRSLNACTELCSELAATGVSDASGIVHDLAVSARALAMYLRDGFRTVCHASTTLPFKVDVRTHDGRTTLTCGDCEVQLHRHTLAKLRRLHATTTTTTNTNTTTTASVMGASDSQHGAGSVGDPEWEAVVLRRAFSVVCRYNSISPANASGYQGALPDHVFAALRDAFGVTHECFASPLNCYFDSYCSLFEDTDKWFGSRGSFFSFHPRCGSFQCNPPFVDGIMTLAAAHVVHLLAGAESNGQAMSFVVVLPDWHAESHHRLMSTRFLVHTELWRANHHQFKDGCQHCTERVVWAANVDTRVYWLQSTAGAARWPVNAATLGVVAQAVSANLDGGGRETKSRARRRRRKRRR